MIVDDEPGMQRVLASALEDAGFLVRTALDGVDCLEKMRIRRPDLVLLDVMMPRMDGFKTCAEIRKIDPAVPIVFHSVSDSPKDIMSALGGLGDSYVLKTEPDAVKVAKIKAVLRRADMAAAKSAKKARARTFRIGDVTIDSAECRAVVKGRNVVLTRMETDILSCLDEGRGSIRSAEDIFAYLHGDSFKGDARTLRSHFSHIKDKIGDKAFASITTIHGVGYRLK